MDSVKAGLAGCVGALAVVAVVMAAGNGNFTSSAPSTSSQAASPETAFHLDFGEQLAADNCSGVGAPVVNVTQSITNDADSGIAGNYWGLDTFNRQIQVWKVADGSYCALVKYEGKFKGISGQTSPGNTGTLTGNESGTITGGYKAIITGTLLSKPTWKTNGNIGTTNYLCDVNGDCPSAASWPDQYFAQGYGFDQPWWGWIYRSGGNKVWVNASTGNQGDII